METHLPILLFLKTLSFFYLQLVHTERKREMVRERERERERENERDIKRDTSEIAFPLVK